MLRLTGQQAQVNIANVLVIASTYLDMTAPLLSFNVPPYVLSGAVVVALLNHRPQLLALGDAVNQAPYKAAPKAPVLAIKPRHTLARDGDAVVVPAGHAGLEVGATLGIVIQRTACRISAGRALDVVAGYTLGNDFSLPLGSHYRPSVRLKHRDGFCPLGTHVVPADDVPSPDALAVQVELDGQCVWQGSTADRVRGVAQLIADVSEFMTLQPGDLLLLGASAGAPLARAGQRVSVSINGLGTLSNTLVAQTA